MAGGVQFLLRAPIWLSIACATLVLSLGCAPRRTPDLLEVDELSHGAVELGTRLEVRGAGFPENDVAELVFRGSLYSPGRRARSDVAIRTEARAASRSRLVVQATRSLLSEFVERGGHSTFHGSIVVRFRSRRSDAPPLTGTLSDVVLDFFGDAPVRRAEEERLRAQADQFGDFVGWTLSDELAVRAVAKDGEAARAGLEPGDRVVSLDGVRAETRADLVPRTDGVLSTVVVARGSGDTSLSLTIDRTGFRKPSADDLSTAWALVGAALLVVFGTGGRRARLWAFVESRLAQQIRPEGRMSVRSVLAMASPAALARSLPRGFRSGPYLVFFGACAAWAALSFGVRFVGPELDLAVLLIGAVAAGVLSALLLGGRSRRGFQFVTGLRAAVASGLALLPAVFAVLSTVIELGSLRLEDAVRVQGAFPWQWRAFQSPWSLAGFLLLVGSCVPEPGPSRWLDSMDPRRGSLGAGLVQLVQWAGTLCLCGLAAVLFLGGWQTDVAGRPELLGATVVVVKAWGALSIVLWWRGLLGEAKQGDFWSAWVRRALPLSLVCLGASAARDRLYDAGSLATELRVASVATALLLIGFAVSTVYRSAHRAATTTAINPWL